VKLFLRTRPTREFGARKEEYSGSLRQTSQREDRKQEQEVVATSLRSLNRREIGDNRNDPNSVIRFGNEKQITSLVCRKFHQTVKKRERPVCSLFCSGNVPSPVWIVPLFACRIGPADFSFSTGGLPWRLLHEPRAFSSA
jgi:hypothetical protein